LGILVVGSIALDRVETPFGSREEVLGGSCPYFVVVASLYAPVYMVSVVGTDFPQAHLDFFRSRKIDLRGLQVVPGKTLRWAGRYGHDLADAETLATELNVLGDFHPIIPDDFRHVPYVFLANIDPDLQIEILSQMQAPRLVVLDSMNYWMIHKRDSLQKAISRVHVVLLNESEVRLFSGESNIIAGARAILSLGPKALVIKRGEHGAMLLISQGQGIDLFMVPAFPVENVVDPTGAGDTFAAGFMGYLAKTGDLSMASLRRAVVHGTLVASFTVQDFSIDRLRPLTLADIEACYSTFRWMTHFEPLSDLEVNRLSRPIWA